MRFEAGRSEYVRGARSELRRTVPTSPSLAPAGVGGGPTPNSVELVAFEGEGEALRADKTAGADRDGGLDAIPLARVEVDLRVLPAGCVGVPCGAGEKQVEQSLDVRESSYAPSRTPATGSGGRTLKRVRPGKKLPCDVGYLTVSNSSLSRLYRAAAVRRHSLLCDALILIHVTRRCDMCCGYVCRAARTSA